MVFGERLRSWARRVKRDGLTLWFAGKSPATPWYAKALGAFVVAYAFSPIDLIPDFIPVLGYLDDVLLLPVLIGLTVKLLPPQVLQYCRRYSPIALGEAVVTPGFQLPNPYVIHARAASYINDDHPEKYLDLAIAQALRVAKDAGIKSMAMPAVGTGVFKFPPELAAEIILKALLSRVTEFADITLVRICVGDAQMKAVFQAALDMATVGSARN